MGNENQAMSTARRLELSDRMSVNRLGYGAMQLTGPGVWGPPADHDAAVAVLRRAVDLGVDHIDTSDTYGPHVANELIREALEPYPDELVIATKVGVARDESGSFNPAASPAALRDQVQDNLNRLGVEALDLVYLRVGGDGLMLPGETPFAESYGALAELRDSGLIRSLGLSGVTAAQLEQARGMAPVAAVQNRYNLADRGSADVLRQCEGDGIAFVPYFPLVAGLLRPGLDKSLLPPGMALTDAQEELLDAVAARHRATRAQVALAWLLATSPVTLLIPGTSSVAHLRENLAASEIRLSAEDLVALDKLT
jgi:pyridoxine 4-dehydrogenase